jgi:hypothetical protein
VLVWRTKRCAVSEYDVSSGRLVRELELPAKLPLPWDEEDAVAEDSKGGSAGEKKEESAGALLRKAKEEKARAAALASEQQRHSGGEAQAVRADGTLVACDAKLVYMFSPADRISQRRRLLRVMELGARPQQVRLPRTAACLGDSLFLAVPTVDNAYDHHGAFAICTLTGR